MSSPDPFRPVALPYIDEMPKYKRIALAKLVLEATEKYFAQPGTEEKYQAWLAKRESSKKQLQEDQHSGNTSR